MAAHAADIAAKHTDPALTVYRFGHRPYPCDFPPRDICSWANRWDDPQRTFRTVYCAESMFTCLNEALADFRPDARVLADLKRMHGEDCDEAIADAGRVPRPWLDRRVLQPAVAVTSGPLLDIDDLHVRSLLEGELAEEVVAAGLRHLDLAELRGAHRTLTQLIARTLFDAGAAGVKYRSRIDDGACFAFFEGRAALTPQGPPVVFSPGLLMRARLRLRVVPDEVDWGAQYLANARGEA